MARKDAIDRGQSAQRLLDDPLLQESFDAIEKDVINALASLTLTGSAETEAQALELTRALQANRRLRSKLWNFVGHGKLEARSGDLAGSKKRK
jgi:hypothetical protein